MLVGDCRSQEDSQQLLLAYLDVPVELVGILLALAMCCIPANLWALGSD